MSTRTANPQRATRNAQPANAALATVFRAEAGRLTAALVRILGDFDVAEEIVQDALLVALERWPVDGIPRQPGAWLLTVARRRALDQLRRQSRFREKLMELEKWPLPQASDDRLRLIFTCCHPSLSREAQVGLTLRAVCGMTTAQIAHAFLTSEAAIAKRLLRARRKIVDAGIPYRLPEPDDLTERLQEVLATLYLLFNEGYLSSSGPTLMRRDIAEDAAWLADLLVHLLPGETEPLGLLALMRLHLARAKSRFDADGGMVLLQDQDRSLWDRSMIASGLALLAEAGRQHRPGPYQVQAAIVACHAEAESYAATDWPQVITLYDLLLNLAPSPVVALNRAVALRHVAGADVALRDVDALAESLETYYLFHAVRADLLRDLARADEARQAEQRALTLTDNAAERALLERRLSY
jgi:RNA polymerase sigma factor (sigma-70 family)